MIKYLEEIYLREELKKYHFILTNLTNKKINRSAFMLLNTDQEKQQGLIEKLRRELGSTTLSGLNNTDVTAIMLNDDGHINMKLKIN